MVLVKKSSGLPTGFRWTISMISGYTKGVVVVVVVVDVVVVVVVVVVGIRP